LVPIGGRLAVVELVIERRLEDERIEREDAALPGARRLCRGCE
jgi:hypothetical protein